MAADTEHELRTLAEKVLSALLTDREAAAHRVAILLEPRRTGGVWTDPVLSEDADLFTVSLGYPGSSRSVEVDVAKGADRSGDMAWAALNIADAFQDEVMELLHEQRPACAGHSHARSVETDGKATWWYCPTDPHDREGIWP